MYILYCIILIDTDHSNHDDLLLINYQIIDTDHIIFGSYGKNIEQKQKRYLMMLQSLCGCGTLCSIAMVFWNLGEAF